jgi:hypothetical protein
MRYLTWAYFISPLWYLAGQRRRTSRHACHAGPRSLQRGTHIPLGACLKEGPHIVLPACLVKVGGDEPAGFVRPQRINAGRELACQMILDDLVGEGNVFLGFSGVSTKRSAPDLATRWRVSRLASATLPSQGVHIFASRKRLRKNFTFSSGLDFAVMMPTAVVAT